MSRHHPSVQIEQGKLLPKEGDWKLPGMAPVATRTRGGGQGRPNLLAAVSSLVGTARGSNMHVIVESGDEADSEESNSDEEIDKEEDNDEESDVEESENLAQEDDDQQDENNKKPSASRVLLDVNLLEDFVEKHTRCLHCHGPLDLSIETVCLASRLKLTCSSCEVDFESMSPSQRNHVRPDKRNRSDDYALNVLFVVGFVSCGDGGAEAARMLGLLGLANDTTMETRSFPLIEERVGPVIRKLAQDIITENLHKEVKKSTTEENFILWEKAQEFPLTLAASVARTALDLKKDAGYPKLNVSFDMGWQQRSSGHRYNSQSGHALFIGKETRLPVAMVIKSKICNFCTAWKSKAAHQGFDPPLHECWKNHEGSSSSMEPQSCLEMVIDLHNNKRVITELICADDDASTRSLLRWSNADYKINNNTAEAPKILVSKGPNKGIKHVVRPDKGKLPGNIPEPRFVADPNHRRKGLTGECYKLYSQSKKLRMTMTKMDCQRLGRNYGYFVRSLGTIPEDEYLQSSEAVLDHHFDIHTNCCSTWCKRKNMTAEEKAASQRYYRSMDNKEDSELYNVLKGIVARFTTMERLKEVDHGMDTNVNESFNNTASWIAPKNKVYCGSGSLHTRLI